PPPGRGDSVHPRWGGLWPPPRLPPWFLAEVGVAATAASPTPAAAFFFPIGLFLGPPRAVTVNPQRGPTESMGRGYTVKPGKAWTRTRSRDEDSEPSKASTGSRSRDDDSKPSKASTRTSSKDDDSKRSGSGKGAKSATKAEANANSSHGGRQTQRRWSVEHEPSGSKNSGHASNSVQRAGTGAGANSDTEGASL